MKEYLFIGGCVDGVWKKVPYGIREWKVPVNPLTQEQQDECFKTGNWEKYNNPSHTYMRTSIRGGVSEEYVYIEENKQREIFHHKTNSVVDFIVQNYRKKE
tara:strand:+ start:40 stop:342 length:303 start_codon:yes stop_codon:yes gene_type:complete